jgi:hypothetical protein
MKFFEKIDIKEIVNLSANPLAGKLYGKGEWNSEFDVETCCYMICRECWRRMHQIMTNENIKTDYSKCSEWIDRKKNKP